MDKDNASVTVANNNKKLRLNSLKDRVLSLSNLNLISEEEINAITSTSKQEVETESEIFRLLMGKDINSSIKILEILKNEMANKKEVIQVFKDSVLPEVEVAGPSSESSPCLVPADNPLKIAAIIHNVFEFLKLDDIKNCRYVSQEWNHVAEPFLRKRAQISFGYPFNLSCFSKTFANFNYVFRSEADMPFTAVRLTQFDGNDAPWPLSSLKELLESWGRNLKELSIDYLKIKDVFNVPARFDPFNIMDLFPECNISKLNIGIRCRVFQNGWYDPQKIELSLDKLVNIKYLRVHDCILKIKAKCRISPIEVEMRDTEISYLSEDGPVINNVLNKFIDFGKVKKFLYTHRRPSNEQLFDLKGNFELELLSLSGIKILNWNDSSWKIGKLALIGIPYSGKTSIHVREMTGTDSFLSLSDIPETVEKLNFNTVEIFPSQAVLPHLTELVFTSHESNLKCFENCATLIALELFTFHREVSVSCIPPNIRKLSIDGSGLQKTGEWNGFPLEKLILKNIAVGKFRNIIKKLQPEELVILLQQTNGKNIALFNLLRQTKKYIAIGRFRWDKIDFATSSFSSLVDRQSEYYLFNNKRGIAIDEDEFGRRLKL